MKSWTTLLIAVGGLAGCHLCDPAGKRGIAPPPAAALPDAAAPVKPGVVGITPETASITFTGSNRLMSHGGHFAAFDGTLQVPSADPGAARVRVVVEMNSVTTKIARLTKHLKADDMFDAARYPTAEFVSESMTPGREPGQVTVAGRLTLHGVTKPVTFPARLVVTDDEVSFDATMTVRQTEFGMTESARATKDEVPVVVSVRGRRR